MSDRDDAEFAGLLLRAAMFAAHKHRGQKRKDHTTPYVNHPLEVAELLARVGRVQDRVTLQAALLHDTIEDTETTAEELTREFGADVARIVLEVTDDKSLPKPERKRLQIERAPHLSRPAQQIKVADKICNVLDLSPTEPGDWPLERKREYLHWAQRVVAGCRGCNPELEGHFDKVVRERESLLGRD